MLKFVRVLSALVIVATSSFAGSASQQITPMAGPCVHLRTPSQCLNYPTGECFWDDADQRCESYYDNEDKCSLITSPRRCISSQYNCFWDSDDQRCERRN